MAIHACQAAFSVSKNDTEQLKLLIKRSVPVQMEELGFKREIFLCEAGNDQVQAGEDQKLDQVVQCAGAGAWHAVAVALPLCITCVGSCNGLSVALWL